MNGDALIHQALAEIVEAAGSEHWAVGGSAGLLLRGLPLAALPRDLDLYCDDPDAGRLHRSLQPFAADEPSFDASGIYQSTLSHYRIHGVKVELVAGFQVSAHGCVYRTEVKRHLIPLGDRLPLRGSGRQVCVAPLAHELLFNMLRGREDRIGLIADAMRLEPQSHEYALRTLIGHNAFTRDMQSRICGWIGAGSGEAGEPAWTRK